MTLRLEIEGGGAKREHSSEAACGGREGGHK